MNLARFEGEVHMVERNDARITLGEAARFDNRFLRIGHDRRKQKDVGPRADVHEG